MKCTSSTPPALVVFLKAPQPGKVKTRLAAELGDEIACAAYVQLVETLLGRIGDLEAVELCHAPDEAQEAIKSWTRPGWTLADQGEGDLGQRMQRAFERKFADGAGRVVLIGSDCPWVNSGDIQQAWESLQTKDLVLGPAKDGGYWLIGLRTPQPALFNDIPWSTDQVLAETLERAKRLGLSVQLLRELTDVDTMEEWRQFVAHSPGLE